MRRPALFAAIALLGCSAPRRQSTPDIAPLSLPFVADSQRSERVTDGVARHFIYTANGPWAINVLDVDRGACHAAVAVKGFPRAAGRKRTSQLLNELDSSGTVVGGVNADFFAPNGTPTNAHVSGGRVITGPNRQPVLAFDSTGRPYVTRLVATSVLSNHAPMVIAGWNRPIADQLSVFDANWGPATDSASNAIELVIDVDSAGARLVAVDTMRSGVSIPPRGYVEVYRGASRTLDIDSYRRRIGQPWDLPRIGVALDAMHPGAARPREVVGGRPVLIRDSAITSAVETEGAAGFATSRHPRTAVGIASHGKRLLLVTVDGRQKPYSDGMTLRELADLMLALGARDAINLDGGGSTTLVYKDPATRRLAIANRPSDPTGERAVGNALAIVKGCARP